MDSTWKNSLALITGASSGIGLSIARTFSKNGVRVILVARNTEKIHQIAEEIRSQGGIAFEYPCDLSIPENCDQLHARIQKELGTPDILVNNAGIGWYGYFHKIPENIAKDLLFLNIIAPTLLCRLFLPQMLQLDKARIINIGSIIGKLPEQGVALYSASKAYLDSFTTSLYRESHGTGLSVSIIRPGPVKTNFFENAAKMENGGRIPAERFAVSSERIASKAWQMVIRPKRYAYVPFYLIVSPLLEVFFSWAIDLVGPLLLRNNKA